MVLLEHPHVLDEAEHIDHILENALEVVLNSPLHEGHEDAARIDIGEGDDFNIFVRAIGQSARLAGC